MDKIDKLRDMILESRKTLVLTGAGVSTDSGIPDFRSEGTGLWEEMDPMEALSTSVLFRDPEKFYRTGFKILRDMDGVEPNDSHRALAYLEKSGYIDGLITQNIDNLHFKAGSKKVYEVHGNTRDGHCMSCYADVSLREIEEKVDRGEIPPICQKCGGKLRPSVTLFGDMLPNDFIKAQREAEAADLIIVIGSSLTVSPVNYLPRLSKNFVIINKTRTIMDDMAALCIRENSSQVLNQLIGRMEA